MIIKYNGIDKCTTILENVTNIKVLHQVYKETEVDRAFAFITSKTIRKEDKLANCILPYNGDCKMIFMSQNDTDYVLLVRGSATVYTDAGNILEEVFA